MRRRIWGLALCSVLMMTNISALSAATPVPSFARDVAPIPFAKCVNCHRPGEVAPMSLLTYDQARPWARAIKDKVVSREMPPWGADPRYGKFRNDFSLTPQEIETIVAWVDGGTLKGNDADMPPQPPVIAGWTGGVEPDYLVEMPVDFPVPAEGELNTTRRSGSRKTALLECSNGVRATGASFATGSRSSAISRTPGRLIGQGRRALSRRRHSRKRSGGRST